MRKARALMEVEVQVSCIIIASSLSLKRGSRIDYVLNLTGSTVLRVSALRMSVSEGNESEEVGCPAGKPILKVAYARCAEVVVVRDDSAELVGP